MGIRVEQPLKAAGEIVAIAGGGTDGAKDFRLPDVGLYRMYPW